MEALIEIVDIRGQVLHAWKGLFNEAVSEYNSSSCAVTIFFNGVEMSDYNLG